LAKDAWNDGDIRRTLELLQEWVPEAGQKDLRGFEWHYLWRCCHSARLTVAGSLHGVANSHIFRGVALSPDGQRVAHAVDNAGVVVRDVNTGTQVYLLKTPNLFISSLAYSPDGRSLAAVSWDIGSPRPAPAATVWDSATGKETYTISLEGEEASALAFRPDGLELAVTSGTEAGFGKPGKVTVLDARTGKTIRTFPTKEAVACVTFSPDGQRIALAIPYLGATILDATTGKELLAIPHPMGIRGVAFSPDGKRLVSACGDRTAKIWDANTGEKLFTLAGHKSDVDSVAFSPNGKRLASTSHDGTARFWDPTSGAGIGILKGHTSPVGNLVFSSDGTRLATAGYDRAVRVWDVNSFTIANQEVLILRGFKSAVTSVVFGADGKCLATADGYSAVTMWNPATGEARRTGRANREHMTGFALSPDSQRIALADDKMIRIWNWETNAELFTLNGNPNYPRDSLGFTAKGERLAAFNQDGRVVELWDIESRRLVRQIKEPEIQTHFSPVVYSADGQFLAISNPFKRISLWNVTGQEILRLGRGYCCAFSADGRRLATSSDNIVELWDTVTGECVVKLKGHSGHVFCVAFSPDGRRVATGSRDGSVKLWNTATGQETFTFKGPRNDGGGRFLAFSPDGHRLASASGDLTVKIWDATPTR
jgi:WD40 repeat protein